MTTHPTLFSEPDGPTLPDAMPGERIVLMDLNVALSANFDQMQNYRMGQFISKVEAYRPNMVELLRAEYVILITARHIRWMRLTLERIKDQTGWLPQEALFNDTDLPGSKAHRVKERALLDHVFPAHGKPRGQYLAIDSNWRTREMYRRRRVRAIDCDRNGTWVAIPP